MKHNQVHKSGGGSSTHGQSSGASSSNGAGDSGGHNMRRCVWNMTQQMQQAASAVPTGIELIVQVLADDGIWARAKLWTVLSDVVRKAHSAGYSGMRTSAAVENITRATIQACTHKGLGRHSCV